MNDVRRPEKFERALGPGSSVMQASSEATRRLCEQGQTFVDAMAEWNSEISQFVSQRMSRNSEALSRIAKCQALPDTFTVQAQWVQDAADDYSKEMQKLMEINSRIMTQLLGTGGSTDARSVPTRSSLRAAAE